MADRDGIRRGADDKPKLVSKRLIGISVDEPKPIIITAGAVWL
ncbi:MAG: hypothetical protein ACL7BU_15890 [Candidatus Phlomobacter fragariae]